MCWLISKCFFATILVHETIANTEINFVNSGEELNFSIPHRICGTVNAGESSTCPIALLLLNKKIGPSKLIVHWRLYIKSYRRW